MTSETKGTLDQEDRRQISLLTAQVFQHLESARQDLLTEEVSPARDELKRAREAIVAIRSLLPRTAVHTRTTGPDGKVIYEDRREVQESRVPLYEGMLHVKTMAPLITARRNATDIAGVQLVESSTISTEVTVDLDLTEAQLARAAKALEANKAEDAAKAIAVAQLRGVDFGYHKEDTPLAEARDAIWLAKRALEENNAVQAEANLAIARQRLRVYREILPEEGRKDVDQMLGEVGQLEAKLRQESGQAQATPSAERSRQGQQITNWWDKATSWFRKRY